MTTIYQIIGFAFYNQDSNSFKTFKLTDKNNPKEIQQDAVQQFIDIDIKNTEAYTLYKYGYDIPKLSIDYIQKQGKSTN